MKTKQKKIYMIGIKGVGMTALAVYYKGQGYDVIGSDVEEEFPTDTILNRNGIKILKNFKESHITDDIDHVVTTGAHNGLNNIEALEAKKRKIVVRTLAEEVGMVMQGHKTGISVCGAHGKTTTSAIIAAMLRYSRKKASYLIGVPSFMNYDGGYFGGYDFLTVEADEYVSSPDIDNTPRFMYQNPQYIVCTSIDFDHPDVYDSLGEVKTAFSDFFNKVNDTDDARILFCHDDENLLDMISVYEHKKKYSYGFSQEADLVLYHERIEGEMCLFDAAFQGKELGTFSINLFGKHNILNAGAALLLSRLLKLDNSEVKEALASFSGLSRRFQNIYKKGRTYLIDDYAHHPAEIEALIDSARQKYPQSRIVLFFQSHTYSRTKALLHDFVHALHKADIAYVCDIFASARDKERQVEFSAKTLEYEAIKKNYENVRYVSFHDFDRVCTSTLKSGDIIITVGAGNLYNWHKNIIKIIDSLEAS